MYNVYYCCLHNDWSTLLHTFVIVGGDTDHQGIKKTETVSDVMCVLWTVVCWYCDKEEEIKMRREKEYATRVAKRANKQKKLNIVALDTNKKGNSSKRKSERERERANAMIK